MSEADSRRLAILVKRSGRTLEDVTEMCARWTQIYQPYGIPRA